MLVSPQKIRWFFVVKALIVPPAWIAILIWSFVKVPSSQGLFSQHATLSGSNLAWAWLSALNSSLGIYSTLGVNIPDFTVCITLTEHHYGIDISVCSLSQRYAKDERA